MEGATKFTELVPFPTSKLLVDKEDNPVPPEITSKTPVIEDVFCVCVDVM